jgi:hypothetical protein
VPPPLGQRLKSLYEELGEPLVVYKTFWPIYLQLLNCFRNSPYVRELAPIIEANEETTRVVEEDHLELLPGLRELRNGANVVGPYGTTQDNAQTGSGLTADRRQHCTEDPETMGTTPPPEYAEFTDDEDSDVE